jgi:hypothetical protein
MNTDTDLSSAPISVIRGKKDLVDPLLEKKFFALRRLCATVAFSRHA